MEFTLTKTRFVPDATFSQLSIEASRLSRLVKVNYNYYIVFDGNPQKAKTQVLDVIICTPTATDDSEFIVSEVFLKDLSRLIHQLRKINNTVKVKPDALNIKLYPAADVLPEIILTNTLSAISDTRVITLGADYNYCLLFLKATFKQIVGYPVLYAPVTADFPAAHRNILLSYYINCACALLGPTAYKAVLTRLVPQIISGEVAIFTPHPDIAQACKDYELDTWRLVMIGFFALVSISKVGADSTHIKAWIDKRIKVLSVKLGAQRDTTVVENIAYDLALVSAYLSEKLAIRQALYPEFLYTQESADDHSPYFAGVKSQVMMILRDYEMSTFMLAYHFASACETEAHTIPIVVSESVIVEKAYKTITAVGKRGTDTLFPHAYACVLEKRPTSLEVVNYPHLAFCAVFNAKMMGSTSWTNYKVGDLSVNVPFHTLKMKTLMPLKKISPISGEEATEDDTVTTYLARHNRGVDPSAQRIVVSGPTVKDIDPFAVPV